MADSPTEGWLLMGDRLRPHPVAECFPSLSEQEYGDLLADVREFGVRVPIVVTADGQIVDGLHRWRAAQETGQPCPQEPLPEGQDPWQAARVLNTARRQLNGSQKAMVAARFSQESRRGRRPQGKTKVQSCTFDVPTVEQAAQIWSISPRSTKSARKVLEQGSALLVAAVDGGEISVSDAATVVDAPKKTQNSALKMVRAGEVRTLEAALKQTEPAPAPVAEVEPAGTELEPEAVGEAAVAAVTEPEPVKSKPKSKPSPAGGGRSRELIVEAIGQAAQLEKVLKRLCGGQVRKQIVAALDIYMKEAEGIESGGAVEWMDSNICFYLQPGDGIEDVLGELLRMFDAGRHKRSG